MLQLVYITTKDKGQAETIGRTLVERRLAACVNILDGMTSIYSWEGKLEQSQEAVLIAKTSTDKVDQLVSAVKNLHTYSVPCALVLPILGGNQGYLDWLQEQLR